MAYAVRAEKVSIRYLTGDFKDIGVKEFLIRNLRNQALEIDRSIEQAAKAFTDCGTRIAALEAAIREAEKALKDQPEVDMDRLKALGILSGLPSDDQFSLFDQLGV